ncbi:MAG: DUF4157 domain-containing protein [Steroidobacteraceae bacterium]
MAKDKRGLPDKLKTDIERLSGMNLDDVRVHLNSPLPAQHQVLAYTQGNDIHVAPGQQRLVAHEAWHVVQQQGGRVSTRGRSHIGLGSDPDTLETERTLLAKRTPIEF